MKWRSLPNGDKFSPRRGIPIPPDGYCLDPRDKYLAHPILRDCEHRFITKETLSCGKILGVIECSYPSINDNVTQMQCFTCTVPKVMSKSNQTPRGTAPNEEINTEVLLPEELVDTGLSDGSPL